jgi:hypothetical protein
MCPDTATISPLLHAVFLFWAAMYGKVRRFKVFLRSEEFLVRNKTSLEKEGFTSV